MSTTKNPLGYGDNQLGRTGEGSVTNTDGLFSARDPGGYLLQ